MLKFSEIIVLFMDFRDETHFLITSSVADDYKSWQFLTPYLLFNNDDSCVVCSALKVSDRVSKITHVSVAGDGSLLVPVVLLIYVIFCGILLKMLHTSCTVEL